MGNPAIYPLIYHCGDSGRGRGSQSPAGRRMTVTAARQAAKTGRMFVATCRSKNSSVMSTTDSGPATPLSDTPNAWAAVRSSVGRLSRADYSFRRTNKARSGGHCVKPAAAGRGTDERLQVRHRLSPADGRHAPHRLRRTLPRCAGGLHDPRGGRQRHRRRRRGGPHAECRRAADVLLHRRRADHDLSRAENGAL